MNIPHTQVKISFSIDSCTCHMEPHTAERALDPVLIVSVIIIVVSLAMATVITEDTSP